MTMTVTYDRLRIGGDQTGDFQTNTFETGDQLLPDVLGLSGGGFVAAYNNGNHLDGSILLNFYDADHALIGTHRKAYDTNATDASGQPKLTELANGNVLVVWDENNTSEGDDGPQASIFTAIGALVSQDIDLGGSAAYGDVDVAALDNGGFVVSFAVSGEIFFRRFDAAGAPQGGITQANTVTAGTQADAQVTVLSDGAIAVAWTDTNPSDQLVKARVFEADGTPRGGEFTVSGGGGDNTQPSLAAGKDGEMIAVFKSTGWDETGVIGDPGISLVIFDFEAEEISSRRVNDEHAGDESHPDVTVLANGFIAVTWTRPSSSDDIYCRIFDPDGGDVSGQFAIANAGLGLNERLSAVSTMLGGMFITSWQDTTTDGDGMAIWSQVTELTRTAVGDGAADVFHGDELRDSMTGGGGDDSLTGGDGADTLDGGLASDLVEGNDGDDLLQGGLNDDEILGGDGDDLIYSVTQADPTNSIQGDSMEGEDGDDTVFGAGGDDSINGGLGEDRISGGDGDDFMEGEEDDDRLTGGGGNDDAYGHAGADKIKGQSGDDTLRGYAGLDTLNGGVGDDILYAEYEAFSGSTDGEALNGANGNDSLFGANGADHLVGLRGKDVMLGRGGADTLEGGSLKDLLNGGLGADLLTGGSEKDTFAYLSILDSANGAEDVLTDAGNQDFIDLSAIDAKVGNPGDQDFTLVGAFSGQKGELVVAYHAGGAYAGFTTVQGDVDGDAAADFTIKIAGDVHNFDNFVL